MLDSLDLTPRSHAELGRFGDLVVRQLQAVSMRKLVANAFQAMMK